MGEGGTYNQYRVACELGRGAMGITYRARDTELDRDVALKILKEDCLSDRNAEERFRREARSAARLQHSNIATVYDSGTANGRFFYVMEFIDGKDLQGYVKDHGHPASVYEACPC